MTLRRHGGQGTPVPSSRPHQSTRGAAPASQRSSGGGVALPDKRRGLLSACSACMVFRRDGGCTRDEGTRWRLYSTEETDTWHTKAEGFFWYTSISTPSTTRNLTRGITRNICRNY